MRLESVQAATDHARLIARRLCGKPVQPYDALPWFWSDQADWKLQIAGLALPDDDSLPGPGDSVLRLRGGRLVAVETINDPRTHMRARRLLAADGPPDAATALAADHRQRARRSGAFVTDEWKDIRCNPASPPRIWPRF